MVDPRDWPDAISLGLLRAVAQEGSISRAALQFSLTQASASTRLRDLERKLGVVLLERRAGGAVPTPAGHVVLELAGEVTEAMDHLVLQTATLRDDARRSLRVASSYTVAEFLLPAWLAALRSRSDDLAVYLEVVNSRVVRDRVADGAVDVGFVEAPEGVDHDGLQSCQVAVDELVLIAAPGHPWVRRRGPLSPSGLASVRLVSREPGSGTRAALVDALRRTGHEPAPALVELGSTTAVIRAVEAGVGVSVLSRLTVARELADGRVREVPTEGIELTRSLRAVWRAGIRLGRPVADLLSAAKALGPTTVAHR